MSSKQSGKTVGRDREALDSGSESQSAHTESGDASPASGAKKPRKPGVKYTTVVQSGYRSPVEGEKRTVLDECVEVVKGKVVLPGVLAKSQYGQNVVLVPSTGTSFLQPTLRQIVEYLSSLDK